jgi:hypothetical protein
MNRPPPERPTGYSSANLPLYEAVDDAKFEEFCTALLNLHPVIWCERHGTTVERRILSASRLLSGTAQRGTDIRAEAEQGEVWMLQCKHVQRFGPRDVEKAVDDMEAGFPHADQYILVITSALSLQAQDAILGRPRWMCWDASRLTTLTQQLRPTEDAIKLVNRFFDQDWVRKLFPWGDQPLLTWQEFFCQELLDDCRHFHHHTPFLPPGDVLPHLETFARAGTARAMVLSAKGGAGKSRLLLELARRLEARDDAPRVRFLRLRGAGLGESEADYLRRQDNLLLVVDDAHRLSGVVAEVARATRQAGSIRLLIATRPQAVESIRSQLYQSGYGEGALENIDLPRWKRADMVELAEQVLDVGHRVHAPHLARLADGCPLLVILGAAELKADRLPQAMTDREAFRERVFKGFIQDFLGSQPESSRKRLDRLLRFLAFVSPAPKDDRLFARGAGVLGCPALEVAEDIESLLAAGLLAETREGIRLYPDLLADAVLLDACLASGHLSPLFREVLGKLRSEEFPALLRNLAQADWEARTRKGASDSLFDPAWKAFLQRFTEAALSGQGELLRQWAGFAVFQPERTIELAELAIQPHAPTPFAVSEADSFRYGTRDEMLRELPALLEPLVNWHPAHANRALDLLWALDAELQPHATQGLSSPLNTIGRAAEFEVHKPLAATESVITWLERKLAEKDGIERIRRQPWILSALLKPCFGRVVEHRWQTGMTLHLAAVPVSVDRTKDVRRRALALIERFASSREPVFAQAALPALREALNPLYPRAGFEPTQETRAAWRPERLAALEVARRVIAAPACPHALLLQLRRWLVDFCRYDRDEEFKRACGQLVEQMPDNLELRLARALTSWPGFGAESASEADGSEEYHIAEQRFAAICSDVAWEAAEHWGTPDRLFTYLGQAVNEVVGLGYTLNWHGIGHALAALGPPWCRALLERLLSPLASALDGFILSLLEQAITLAPDLYQEALVKLPGEGAPAKLILLIHALGQKHRGAHGLTAAELQAVLQATVRTEPSVQRALASLAGSHFANQPDWAMELLLRLRPSEEEGAAEILRSLATLAHHRADQLRAADVARCLENLGARCLGTELADPDHVNLLATRFPAVVYEHLARLLDATGDVDSSPFILRLLNRTPRFGKFADPTYPDRALQDQWTRALADPPTRAVRLALARSLMWSDAAAVPRRVHRLLDRCTSAEELTLAVGLVAAEGSRFVFLFPELVREMLTRAAELEGVARVWRALRLSALGGGRSYTGGELDAAYRYLLEQSESLATRFRDDPVLGGFYRAVAEEEQRGIAQRREEYRLSQEASE